MLPLVVFVAMPLLGAVLLVAEHSRRSGRTRFAKEMGRTTVVILGALLGLTAVLSALILSMYLVSGALGASLLQRAYATTTVVLITALILYAARNALRVGLSHPSDESVAELARHTRNSEELRLSGWLLILAPLLLLGIVGLILIPVLVLFGFFYGSSRRARESRFLWTVALAVENDLPMDDEVKSFSLSLWNRNRWAYEGIANRMREGRSFVDALEISGVLSRPLVAEIRAAQAAGTLSQALKRIAARQTSSLFDSRIEGTTIIASTYLFWLLAMIFCVVGFVMYWIIPKFKDIFNDFNVDLPAWTIQAISLSDAFISSFLFVMPLIGLPIVAGLMVVFVGVFGWDNLNYPLLMRWFPRRDTPGMLRSLAYLVEVGRPLPEELEVMSEHQRRIDLRERMARMQQASEGGEPIWNVFASEGFVRRPEADALEAASRAGNLHWAMRTLADSMERTRQYRLQVWLEFLKPAAVIGIGCVVGFFVIAFFLPLVKLIQELS